MLEQNHSKLKRIVLFYFTVWRLDFLPQPKWKFLNFLKLSVYPVCTAFGCFFEIWHLIFQIEDYSDLIDIAFSTSLAIGLYQCLMIYFMTVVYNRERIMEIFGFFENLLTSKDALMAGFRKKRFGFSTKIAVIFAEYFLWVSFICWFFVVGYCAYLTGYSSPMLYYTPGIPRESIFFYSFNFISQATVFFVSYELIMISDVVTMIMISYCQAEIESIADLILKLDDEEVAVKEAGVILRKAYEVHRILSDQSNKLTMSFWHIYLQQLLTKLLYLCTMLLAFKSLTEVPIAAVLCLGLMMTQVFILCFFGQIVMNSSERMSAAIYMTKWYEMRVRDQKDMIMLMMRFHHPVKVETFGFGTISIYTFVQICKASVSYAAILYTVLQ